MTKIFGCGLYRTGTSSLALAIHNLGIRTIHHGIFLRFVETINRNRGRPLLWGLEDKYDAFFDGTVMYAWGMFDNQYPGSKFIMTYRDQDSWYRSIKARSDDDTTRRVRQLELRTEAQWRAHHTDHYNRINNYFRGREHQLLKINICEGEGWEKLCPFIEKEIPDFEFPHENATAGMGPVKTHWQGLT